MPFVPFVSNRYYTYLYRSFGSAFVCQKGGKQNIGQKEKA